MALSAQTQPIAVALFIRPDIYTTRQGEEGGEIKNAALKVQVGACGSPLNCMSCAFHRIQ
jgi:hypothetical protein